MTTFEISVQIAKEIILRQTFETEQVYSLTDFVEAVRDSGLIPDMNQVMNSTYEALSELLDEEKLALFSGKAMYAGALYVKQIP